MIKCEKYLKCGLSNFEYRVPRLGEMRTFSANACLESFNPQTPELKPTANRTKKKLPKIDLIYQLVVLNLNWQNSTSVQQFFDRYKNDGREHFFIFLHIPKTHNE